MVHCLVVDRFLDVLTSLFNARNLFQNTKPQLYACLPNQNELTPLPSLPFLLHELGQCSLKVNVLLNCNVCSYNICGCLPTIPYSAARYVEYFTRGSVAYNLDLFPNVFPRLMLNYIIPIFSGAPRPFPHLRLPFHVPVISIVYAGFGALVSSHL